jgi:hypothetical protein
VLERAQLVWLRAVSLARQNPDQDSFVGVLDLLRTARHGPSTVLHALALGRAHQRATPADIPTRDAVGLLTRTITWLGKRSDDSDVPRARPRSRLAT